MLTMDHTILPATRVVIPKDMGHVCQHSPATEHYCSLAKGKRLRCYVVLGYIPRWFAQWTPEI